MAEADAPGVFQPRDARPPASVLFVCGMNAIRSPMAAAITAQLFPGLYVASAGVRKGEPDPFVTVVMEESGLDLARHKPHTIEELEDTNFDLVVTLSPQAHHRALELTRTMAVTVEYWPTPDPTLVEGTREQILDAYRDVRDGLRRRIKERFGWAPLPSGQGRQAAAVSLIRQFGYGPAAPSQAYGRQAVSPRDVHHFIDRTEE